MQNTQKTEQHSFDISFHIDRDNNPRMSVHKTRGKTKSVRVNKAFYTQVLEMVTEIQKLES